MGRGRRGIINQSSKKRKGDLVVRKNQHNFARIGDKKITSIVSVTCEFIESLKKMDPRFVAQAICHN